MPSFLNQPEQPNPESLYLLPKDELVRRLGELSLENATLWRRVYYDRKTDIPSYDAMRDVVAYIETILTQPNQTEWLWFGERQFNRVGVGYVDVDNFKRVNDELGHAEGDEVLKIIAAAMSQALRAQKDDVFHLKGRRLDLIFRSSNAADEFVIIMPYNHQSLHENAAGHDWNEQFITSVRNYLRQLRLLKHEDGRAQFPWAEYVGVSIGMAVLNPENNDTFADTLQQAERHMYLDKKGKNLR